MSKLIESPPTDEELTKAIIQQALWITYEKTGDVAYKKLYEKWYDGFEGIAIGGLDG
ncbi:MAG TPA: hypothetical protein VIK78_03255 [Ruminiclostridium sp.]